MNKVRLANNVAAILANPKKLFALYSVDAAIWVAVGFAAAYAAINFGGF